jgi:glycosyltransferase involved in cell wall biosynthesis
MSDKASLEGSRSPQLVSVIVPHFNDYENLEACLALLAKQSFPKSRTEIIVADNGSSRGLEEVRRLVGDRGEVIGVEERGAGPARNGGVTASRGDALAFIDSDCRPDERWLEEGVKTLGSADLAGGFVGVLVEDPRRLTGAEAFEAVFAFQNERYVKDKHFTVTASMFVWRSVFDAVGGFVNGVPEDWEWCQRAWKKGFRIAYAQGSIVGHPARRNMTELKKKWRRLTLEWMEAWDRQGASPARVLARHWAVLLSIAPHALTVLTSKKVDGLRNRMGALWALAVIRSYRFVLAHQILLSPQSDSKSK